MMFDNYSIDVQGNRDEIHTQPTFLFGSKGGWNLNFDVAYAEYGFPYSDTLAVLYSSDCGSSWSLIYVKGGDDLETSNNTTDPFVPTSMQWRTEIVSLGLILEDMDVIFAFQNRGRWGNRIYVDNINLDYISNTEESNFSEWMLFPNPAEDLLTIRSPQQRGMLEIIDATGRLVERVMILEESIILDMSDWAPGVYLFRLGPLKHRVLVR